MGAHPPVRALSTPPPYVMAYNNLSRSWIMLIIIVILLNVVVKSSGKSDAEILLKFRESLENHGMLSSWSASKPPCTKDFSNWKGVVCHDGDVFALKLDNMGLKGSIDVDTLTELPSLRSIGLLNNNFEGSLPEFKKLSSLKTIFLSNNKFSGEIPQDAFEGMKSLKKLDLDNNKFTGQIPLSLADLPKLIEVKLENNGFQGQIPSFKQERWITFNVTNNELEGPIPFVFKSFNVSSFSGNKYLCGPPLEQCGAASGSLSVGTIVIVVIVVVAALAAIVAVVIILIRRKKTTPEEETRSASQDTNQVATDGLEKLEQGSPEHSSNTKSDQSVKLSFLRDDTRQFDMTDLLRASAEILGSGVFGSTYKAAISDGPVMVVKRYKKMNNVDKDEFNEYMTRLGRLNHTNLLPLVAYYYRKEEKLFVTRHISNFSLAVHLHGNKSRGKPSPDWPKRLKIIKGIGRGLMYLYNELPSLIAPHGHLKSSNVLLNASFEPLLADYGLIPLVNPEHAQENMIAYKSPEYKQTRRITKRTDVWSLGILILEILTGKFPSNFLQQGKGSDVDITVWVESILREEWTTEVFDKDMTGTNGAEGQIIKLLKVGLNCCEADVDKRLDIKEAVGKIEEVKERDGA